MLPPADGMSTEARSVLATTLLMTVWWILEVLPLAVTGLLPVVLFPLLGVMDTAGATAPYAHYVNFLILGGFFIGISLEKWNLHKRIALNIINALGDAPARIMLGFMLSAFFLSMWISNVATAIMMVPIGLSVVEQVAKLSEQAGHADMVRNRFGVGLMLCIIYAGNIGGMSTLIGTPSNAVLAGLVAESFEQEISFLDWFLVVFPLGVVMLMVTWGYLSQIAFKTKSGSFHNGMEVISKELRSLGRITKPQLMTLVVLGSTAFCWVIRSVIRLPSMDMINDATIAIFFGVLLFMIPADKQFNTFLLDWKTARKIPWGVLILLGGGLSLAKGIKTSGLDLWLVSQLEHVSSASAYLVILSVVVVTIFLTQIASNVATTTILVPLLGGISLAFSLHPFALIMAAGISASFAFMLPTATPGNSIVFSYPQISVRDLTKHGLVLSLIGVVLVPLLILYVLPLIWQFDLWSIPDWAVPK